MHMKTFGINTESCACEKKWWTGVGSYLHCVKSRSEKWEGSEDRIFLSHDLQQNVENVTPAEAV